jgi:hypothetical protein
MDSTLVDRSLERSNNWTCSDIDSALCYCYLVMVIGALRLKSDVHGAVQDEPPQTGVLAFLLRPIDVTNDTGVVLGLLLL